MNRKVFLVTVGMSAVATIISGCASSLRPFGSEGYVDLHADEKGLRAWYDGVNGLLSTAKNEDVHTLDNHHKLRGQQELTERTALNVRFGKEASHE